MPKFDYVQLLTQTEYIVFDEKNFDLVERDGYIGRKLSVRARRLASKNTNIPTNKIKVNINTGYTTIGIPAKILGIDYPELINNETFDTALQNLVKLGILNEVDFKSIRENSKLTTVDLTNDYLFDEAPTLKHYLTLAKAVANPYRWNPRVFNNGGGGGGLSLLKIVKEDVEKLIIYDKFIEMQLNRNRSFNNTYGKFYQNRGSIRAEASLFSAQSIKNRFGSNSLFDVLHSKKQPLKPMFEDLFISDESINYNKKPNKTQARNIAFSEAYGNIPEKVAAAIMQDPTKKHNRVRLFQDIMKATLSVDSEAKEMLKFLENLKNIN